METRESQMTERAETREFVRAELARRTSEKGKADVVPSLRNAVLDDAPAVVDCGDAAAS
jgi:hypothetical protein